MVHSHQKRTVMQFQNLFHQPFDRLQLVRFFPQRVLQGLNHLILCDNYLVLGGGRFRFRHHSLSSIGVTGKFGIRTGLVSNHVERSGDTWCMVGGIMQEKSPEIPIPEHVGRRNAMCRTQPRTNIRSTRGPQIQPARGARKKSEACLVGFTTTGTAFSIGGRCWRPHLQAVGRPGRPRGEAGPRVDHGKFDEGGGLRVHIDLSMTNKN